MVPGITSKTKQKIKKLENSNILTKLFFDKNILTKLPSKPMDASQET